MITPELRRFPEKRICVFASTSLHESILRTADRLADGRESGGFLVGRLIEEGRVQLVDYVSPGLWNGERRRTRTSIELDFQGARRWRDELYAAGEIGGRDQVIGMWHTHPIEGERPVADGEPSILDRQNAFEVGAIVGADVVVDLILAERRRGSFEIECWVTRRDEQGEAVTEGAFLMVPERREYEPPLPQLSGFGSMSRPSRQ